MHGMVGGKLILSGEELPVNGVGYHDHNWGNTDMSLSRAGWGWGRMYDPVFTFVYGWFIAKDGEETKPQLYLSMNDQVIFASNLYRTHIVGYVIFPIFIIPGMVAGPIRHVNLVHFK